jgi:hypothetical protein
VEVVKKWLRLKFVSVFYDGRCFVNEERKCKSHLKIIYVQRIQYIFCVQRSVAGLCVRDMRWI